MEYVPNEHGRASQASGGQGRQPSLDQVMPALFHELRRLARRELNRERATHTLDSVALVAEAYLKLARQDGLRWESRAHFFGIAARAMRTILIDYARMLQAQKRAGRVVPLTVMTSAESISSTPSPLDVLALEDALAKLEQVNVEASRVAECRIFAGLTLEETADALDVSYATVRRRWSFAKAWLRREFGMPQ